MTNTRGPRSLQHRLLISFIAIAAGSLLVAGTATVVFVRRGAQHAAVSDVQHKASNIQANLTKLQDLLPRQGDATPTALGTRRATRAAATLKGLGVRLFLNELRATVQVSDARILIYRNGAVLSYDELNSTPRGRILVGNDPDARLLVSLPAGVSATDLRLAEVANNATSTLRQRDAVYLATQLHIDGLGTGQAIVVLSETVDTAGVRRTTLAFLFSAAVALMFCVLVSVWLSRRLTRPLLAIESTAQAIAGGNLSARIVVDRTTDRELADVANTLNQMAHDLDAARNAERMFLQAVSHDLRTPLTSIRGYSEALADGTLDDADPPTRARAANVIRTEAQRLERLVRDLLDLSRLESREFSLRPRPCDAIEVVRTTTDGFRLQAEAAGITIEFAPGDRRTLASDLDPERLSQAVANLIENALKFAHVRVSVELSATDDEIAIVIHDDGLGIPVAAQHRVFERLYTTRGTPGRAVGTGLGLAIVNELATAMGGHCRLRESSEHGTAFELVIRRGDTTEPNIPA